MFDIERCEKLEISDQEIFDLLSHVYVQSGFTTAERAKIIFNPASVRRRGVMFAARETSNHEFCGMIIVVPPGSPAIVRAEANECEIHLLGVGENFRGQGLGRQLVTRALEFIEANNWRKIVLWTQKPMTEAQGLYKSCGFVCVGEMEKMGVEFLVYERECG